MGNFVLLFCSLQILFVLSNSLAIEANEGQMVDEYGPAEVYIDHELDPEVVAFANRQVNRLPLEDDSNVRIRRAVKYKVLESPGLYSHFRNIQDEDNLKINPHRRRYRRSTGRISKSELHSDEVEDLDHVDTLKRNEGSDFSIENVPNAQKQVGKPAYYSSDSSRTMDKWVKAPYGDFQSRARKDEEDSHGESTSNVGTKMRTPRVNFITQQGQSSGAGNKDDAPIDGPEARERERERDREQNNNNNNNNNNSNGNKYDNKYDNKQGGSDDSYRKPSNDRYYPSSYNKYYDNFDRPVYGVNQYPTPYQPNYYNRDYQPPAPYNPYYEKYNPYDKYSPYDKYNPYDKFYDRHHDRSAIVPPPGMSRMTPPVGPSSSFYYRHQYNDFDDYIPRSVPNYYYSDKRFDVPLEPREPYESYRPYLQNNDVNSRPGRIVYYANLPEVVRTPSNYRYATARYADSIPNYRESLPYYERDEYSARTAKSINYRDVQPSTTMRISSAPVRSGTPRDGTFYG